MRGTGSCESLDYTRSPPPACRSESSYPRRGRAHPPRGKECRVPIGSAPILEAPECVRYWFKPATESTMGLEFAFIPGFNKALQASPAATEARSKLLGTIANGRFTPRLRAIVSLVVSQESRSEYAMWAQNCVARRAGLTGEDVIFAQAATALDAREAAVAKLAHIIARTGCFDPDEVHRLTPDPRLQPADVVDV